MKKKDELIKPESCFNRAGPETNVFVLLDWDPATAETIRFWALSRIKRGLNKPDDPQIKEAYALANEIEKNLDVVRAARGSKTALNPSAAWPFPEEKR